jgi:hypothetical protein
MHAFAQNRFNGLGMAALLDFCGEVGLHFLPTSLDKACRD